MSEAQTVRRAPIITSEVPRIGYTRAEAAEIIGIGTDLFDRAVSAGTMPQPRLLGSRLLWDIDELVRAFRELPHKASSISDANAQSSYDDNMV